MATCSSSSGPCLSTEASHIVNQNPCRPSSNENENKSTGQSMLLHPVRRASFSYSSICPSMAQAFVSHSYFGLIRRPPVFRTPPQNGPFRFVLAGRGAGRSSTGKRRPNLGSAPAEKTWQYSIFRAEPIGKSGKALEYFTAKLKKEKKKKKITPNSARPPTRCLRLCHFPGGPLRCLPPAVFCILVQ